MINAEKKLAVVLGSGLDSLLKKVSNVKIIRKDKKGIHNIKTAEAEMNRIPVILITGRKHFYEGYRLGEITEYISFLLSLNVTHLLLTNASGGVNPNFKVGDMMLIDSYVNLNSKLVSVKPFRKQNDEFSNMIIGKCRQSQIDLKKGTYGCFPGPVYETNSEIRFLRKYGIDAAGMSTVPEIIRAELSGLKTAAISVITNLLRENLIGSTSHEQVITASNTASFSLGLLVTLVLAELNK